MKKLALAVALVAVATLSVRAQGTVDFRNRASIVGGDSVDAPVFDVDGITKVGNATIVAQLYYGTAQVGPWTAVAGNPAPFRTGSGAGYWNAGTSSRELAGITPGGTAWLVVKAWDSSYATMELALAGGGKYGQTTPFSIVTGGAGVPPSLPAIMKNMTSFQLQVIPEPSTIALLGLGVAALFLRRRK